MPLNPLTLAALTLSSPLTASIAASIAGSLLLGFFLLRWMSGPPALVARRAGLIALRTAAVLTLLAILLNPSDVVQLPGPVDRPDVFYLLDTSQSMAAGASETRFNHAARMMREAQELVSGRPHANVKLFRFGHRLAAVDDPSTIGIVDDRTSLSKQGASTARGSSGVAFAADPAPPPARPTPLAPTDSDTQLMTALSQASSRFGRKPPAGLIVFSDGRTRDEAAVDQFAAQFARLKVPVHVAPVGDLNKGGDVAIVAAVVPPRVRRFAEVDVHVFLRSYGYDGRRCEVSILSPGEDGVERAIAPPVPTTLHDGFQSLGLTFRSGAKPQKLKIQVSELEQEASLTNNQFTAEVGIDRTKIRVLYVEGSTQPRQAVQQGTLDRIRGPFSDLQQALSEDDDIECVVLAAPNGRGMLQRLNENGGAIGQGFATTVAELSAFDALILSDVSANSFTEEQLEWIENWIGQRGAGLLMVGGQKSFAAGGWNETPLAELLPIVMKENDDWIPGTQVAVQAPPMALTHPLWRIVTDDAQNRDIVSRFPPFFGANLWAGVKSNLTEVIGVSDLATATAPQVPVQQVMPVEEVSVFEALQRRLLTPTQRPAQPSDNSLQKPVLNQPAIVAGRYGRGRTMALSMPITSPWANDMLSAWSTGETRHYGKFWRNAIYWLTESSSIGRRRLIVNADKTFFRPGETITLNAMAFNESATRTGNYRITAMIEPQSSLNDLESNYAPVRWPDGKPRESGESGPFIAWGEEFEINRADGLDGKPGYTIELPIADALSIGSASQSLRVEVTAMEDFTQVDSTSLDIQILHDPFEQQNPFPNHELLASIAKQSGGKVLSNASDLAGVLRDVEMKVGTPVVKVTPVWSTWLVWLWILGLLTAEWIWRRFVGLA